MLALTPTPVPAPTVTVTQTVIVPTAFPTPKITITPPDEGLLEYAVKGVLLSDFGGAALGAIAAMWVAYKIMNRDRRIREEDRQESEAVYLENRRQENAQRLVDALTKLLIAIGAGKYEEIQELLFAASIEAAPFVRDIADDDEDREFKQRLKSRLVDASLTGLFIKTQDDAAKAGGVVNTTIAEIQDWRRRPVSKSAKDAETTDNQDNSWWRRLEQKMPVEVRLRYRGFGRGAR
ncbi:hypothetical protein ACSDR0_43415 [Streptosporangium sp. G11]|uniref:hypothetical protein n=1 Tax=Streptosporangium sp. G11 TaxID=3436926 RepID=UPI003EBC3575